MIIRNVLQSFPWKLVFLICLIATLAFEYKPLEYSFSSLSSYTLPGSTNQKIYFYLSDIFACLVILSCGVFWKKKKQDLLTRLSRFCLFGFFVFSIFSVLFSSFAFYGWQFFRLMNLAICLLLSITLSSSNAFSKKELLATVLGAWVVFSLYQSILALWQYITQAPVGILGEVDFVHLQGGGSGFTLQSFKSWIFDALDIVSVKKRFLYRPYGTMLHPNILGGVVFVGSIATLHFLSLATKKWQSTLLVIAITLQVVSLFISYSRAATIAWFMAMSFWFIGYCKLVKKNRTTNQKLWFVAKIALIVCVGGFFFYQQNSVRGIFFDKEKDPQYEISSSKYLDFDKRIDNQQIALQMIQASPLVGVGLENYMLQVMQNRKEGKISQEGEVFPVHNIYLLLAVEIGVIGAVFFLGYLLIILWKIAHSFFFSMQDVLLSSMFLGLLLIGFCDFYLVLFQVGRFAFFLISALLIRSVQKEETLKENTLEERLSCF